MRAGVPRPAQRRDRLLRTAHLELESCLLRCTNNYDLSYGDEERAEANDFAALGTADGEWPSDAEEEGDDEPQECGRGVCVRAVSATLRAAHCTFQRAGGGAIHLLAHALPPTMHELLAGDAQPPSAPPQPGATVSLAGLRARPELNEQRGIYVGPKPGDAEPPRFLVRLPFSPSDPEEVIGVQLGALRVPPPSEWPVSHEVECCAFLRNCRGDNDTMARAGHGVVHVLGQLEARVTNCRFRRNYGHAVARERRPDLDDVIRPDRVPLSGTLRAAMAACTRLDEARRGEVWLAGNELVDNCDVRGPCREAVERVPTRAARKQRKLDETTIDFDDSRRPGDVGDEFDDEDGSSADDC